MEDIKKGFDHPWDVVNAIPDFSTKSVIVQFADWTVRTIDLSHLIDREDPGVFESLRHEHFFNRVRVLDGLVTWPGELDLDPEHMYNMSH